MPVRRFDGTNDEIRCSIGGSNLTGAFTLLALHRITTAQIQTLFGTSTSAPAVGAHLGVNASNFPSLSIGGTTLNGAEVGGSPATGEWLQSCVTKASGSVAPRWHQYRFTEGVHRHANDGTAIANAGSQAGGTVRFGEKLDIDDYKGDFAACICWASVLSDAEIESLTSKSALTEWLSVGTPAGAWFFDQASTATELLDETAGGANQTTIEGTEVIGEEPPIPYELAATPRRLTLLGVG